MPSKDLSRSNDKRKAKRHPPRHGVQDSKTAERLGQPAAIVQRAAFASGSLTAEEVLRLQSAVGNQAVSQLLGVEGPTLESGKGPRSVKAQAKLAVSSPDDVYEREANRVAKAVSRSISKTQAAEYERSSGGRNLADDVREPMERAFGVGFGDVRVHTGSEADKLNEALSARAFTTGKDIFFREGEYSPGSDSGRELIAHELTHVVQQAGSRLNRLKTKGLASSHVSTAISNSPGQTIQRLMTLNTFQKNTSTGTFAIRDPLLKEIDEWIEEYHKHFDPPRNEAERDLMCSILEEITEAGGKLQIKDTPPLMHKIIEGLKEQARKDKERLEAMDSFLDIPVAVSKKEESNIESLTKTMKGDVQSSLTAVAPLIDFAVPDTGDKTTLKIILEVPLPPPGFIGFDLECKAERGEDTVKARLEFLCTGGAKGGPGAKLKGKLGGYIEAQAKDSVKVMNLISYGMYRRLRESSVVPRELANVMWGGSTSRKGWKLAERWAAAIEKGVFGEDVSAEKEKYFVETGGIAALEGAILAGGAVLEPEGIRLEGRRASGRKYSKKSIEALKLRGGKKLEEAAKEELAAPPPSKRGAQKKLGESVVTWTGTGKAVLGTIGVVVSMSRSWKTEEREKEIAGPLTIDVSGSFRVPVNELGEDKALYTLFGKWLVDLTPTIRKLFRKSSSIPEASSSAKGQAAGKAAKIIGVDEAIIGGLASLSDSSKEWKPQIKIPKPSSKTKGVTRVEGELSLQIKRDVDKKATSFTFSLSTVNVVGLDAPAISVILSKKKQLFSTKWPRT